jgi:urease accessory protein
VRAAATLSATAEGIRWRDAAPVAVRPTGPGEVHLLQAAGGPLGGDDLRLALTVGPGRALTVRSAGATVAQPGPSGEPARFTVTADLAAGASLRWVPRPTVVCDRADFRTALRADLPGDAFLLARELVVLGRSGEAGGRCAAELTVTVAGRPLLSHETLLDGADPVLSGPAGSGGHRVHGATVLAGRGVPEAAERDGVTGGVTWGVLPLDGPGVLVLALGASAAAVESMMDTLARDLQPVSELTRTAR